MKKEQLQQIVDRQNEVIANLQAIEKEHQKTNGELIVENKQLKEIIDKAIEYIENNWITYEDTKTVYYEELNIQITDIKELLEILKGDRNEIN